MNLKERMNIEELNLFLMSIVAHPDRKQRNKFDRCLMSWLELHNAPFLPRDVREVLLRHNGTRRARFRLTPALRELACRFVSVVYTCPELRTSGSSVRIVQQNTDDPDQGLLINRNLDVLSLHRSASTKYRAQRRQFHCQMFTSSASRWLVHLQQGETLARVDCSWTEAMELQVQGLVPWQKKTTLCGRLVSTPSGESRALDLVNEFRNGVWCVRPAETEGIILLSAWALKGGRLLITHTPSGAQRGLAVDLRDFEENARMPAIVIGMANSDYWLSGKLYPSIDVDAEDRAAMAQALYIPSNWFSPELIARLNLPRIPEGSKPAVPAEAVDEI